MIAALALAVLVNAVKPVQVDYLAVPPEVERVMVLRWHAGGEPARVDVPVTRDGSRARLLVSQGPAVVVVFFRHDGAYLIDGPVAIADGRVERRLDEIWRMTVQGGTSGAAPGAPPIAWLGTGGPAGDPWPACWWATDTTWSCMGVAVGAAGVVLASDGQRLWSGPRRPRAATASMSPSTWGRLLLVSDRGSDVPPRLTVTIARAVPPVRRPRSVRVDTAALPDVRVTRVDPAAIWIAGDTSPPSSWVEVRSARSGPSYLPLSELVEGPPGVPVRVLLDDTRVVNAMILSDRAQPAGGALVTVFRLIDPAPHTRMAAAREPPPRRVLASEIVADEDGRVRLEGLGDGVYEIVAWHPRFGRGSLLLPEGTDRVTINVMSPGIARGRVLAGGTPAAGVDVTVVPDPYAAALAEDLLDLKGGDARTGLDGRFAVTLAAGGGGEVRVGGGTYPVRRVPLPAARVPIVELGEIELGRGVTVSIVLDQDPGCDVRAAGPIGRTGLRIVTAVRTGAGLFTITLPEAGSWEFGLLCGRDERALLPPVVHVTGQSSSLAFAVR